MASYGNLSLSDLIVYNSAGDASGSLTFDTNSDENFAMNKGLDINGDLNITGGQIQISNSTGSDTILSMIPGSAASTTFLGVSTSLQIGSNTGGTDCYLQIQNGNTTGNLYYNNTGDNNFYMNTGLDINGDLNISPTYELNVGSSANASTTNLYGNLNLLNLSTTNSTISFGQYGSPGLSYNNLSDGNLYMNTGLDISGNLVFTQQTATSTEQFKGIQLNYSAQGSYLCFPYANTNGSSMNTNAFSPPSGTTPTGLGIIWDNTSSQGEVDLIGYGGGSSTSGGITIYGYNTTSGETRIADFWPNGSIIYTSLDVSGNNLTLSNNSSSVSLNASSEYPNFLSLGGSGIIVDNGGQYVFNAGTPLATLTYNTTTDQNFNLNYGLDINNGGLTIINDDCSFNIYTSTAVTGGISNQFMMVEGNGIGFPNNNSQIVFQYSGADNAVITYSGADEPGYGGLIINSPLGLVFANDNAKLAYQAPTGGIGDATLTFSTTTNNFETNYGMTVGGGLNVASVANFNMPSGTLSNNSLYPFVFQQYSVNINNETQTFNINPGVGFVSVTIVDYPCVNLYSYVAFDAGAQSGPAGKIVSIVSPAGTSNYDINVVLSGLTISINAASTSLYSANASINIISF